MRKVNKRSLIQICNHLIFYSQVKYHSNSIKSRTFHRPHSQISSNFWFWFLGRHVAIITKLHLTPVRYQITESTELMLLYRCFPSSLISSEKFNFLVYQDRCQIWEGKNCQTTSVGLIKLWEFNSLIELDIWSCDADKCILVWNLTLTIYPLNCNTNIVGCVFLWYLVSTPPPRRSAIPWCLCRPSSSREFVYLQIQTLIYCT